MDLLSEQAIPMAGQALNTINAKSRANKSEPESQHDQAARTQQTQLSSMTNINENTPLRRPRELPTNVQTKGGFGGDREVGNTNSGRPIGFVTNIDPNDQSIGSQNISPTYQSDSSLYDGDAWSKLWFQRVMLLSLIRLLVFVRKLYEDFQTTKLYNASGQTGYYIVAILTLFSPTIIFTTYRICRYLQVSLPELRPNTSDAQCPYPLSTIATGSTQPTASAADKSPASEQADDMDGLVTARQTPVPQSNSIQEDKFQDSKSQQLEATQTTTIDTSTNTQDEAANVQAPEMLVAGKPQSSGLDVPTQNASRVIMGSSEQILHGILYIFWQLKRQVDVIGYLVERACLWRKPSNDEIRELELLRTGSDGLEWFQDFYAAFLAILVQVYTLGIHWRGDSQYKGSSQNIPGVVERVMADSPEGLVVSNAAKAVSDTLNKQRVLGNLSEPKDLLILSELLVSSAVVVSLLIAVRRKDDGPLTLALSMLGWGSIFASRIIIIALSFVHLGWIIMASVLVAHIVIITVWIYKIAVDSHNDKASETESLIWERDPEAKKSRQIIDDTQDTLSSVRIKNWTLLEHFILVVQVLTLFALPSIFYWPIMFNLRLHCRPLKYLLIILTENFLLIPGVWFSISSTATPGQWYLLCAVGAFSIVGFIFIFLYVSCKPTLTDYFARADHIFNATEQAGIYFEFCSRVFKMPNLSDPKFKRLMNQSEELECIEN